MGNKRKQYDTSGRRYRSDPTRPAKNWEILYRAGSEPGGNDEEEWLERWQDPRNGMNCGKLPDDSHGVIRVSVGGGAGLPITHDYCVYRGERAEAIQLLKTALNALQDHQEGDSSAP